MDTMTNSSGSLSSNTTIASQPTVALITTQSELDIAVIIGVTIAVVCLVGLVILVSVLYIRSRRPVSRQQRTTPSKDWVDTGHSNESYVRDPEGQDDFVPHMRATERLSAYRDSHLYEEVCPKSTNGLLMSAMDNRNLKYPTTEKVLDETRTSNIYEDVTPKDTVSATRQSDVKISAPIKHTHRVDVNGWKGSSVGHKSDNYSVAEKNNNETRTSNIYEDVTPKDVISSKAPPVVEFAVAGEWKTIPQLERKHLTSSGSDHMAIVSSRVSSLGDAKPENPYYDLESPEECSDCLMKIECRREGHPRNSATGSAEQIYFDLETPVIADSTKEELDCECVSLGDQDNAATTACVHSEVGDGSTTAQLDGSPSNISNIFEDESANDGLLSTGQVDQNDNVVKLTNLICKGSVSDNSYDKS